jgi:hypothetical protein
MGKAVGVDGVLVPFGLDQIRAQAGRLPPAWANLS